MQLVERLRQTNEGKFGREPQGLAGWLLKLLQNGRGLRETRSRQMHVVETLPLGGKRMLMLVECGGERFLVGGGAESVQVIAPVITPIVVPTKESALPATAKNLDSPCQ